MSRRPTFHLSISAITVACALILNWLVASDASPLSRYFVLHDALPNMWGAVNIIPGIASIVASRSSGFTSDVIFYVVFVIQWFVVGLILSFVVLLFRMRHEKPTTLLDSGARFQ